MEPYDLDSSYLCIEVIRQTLVGLGIESDWVLDIRAVRKDRWNIPEFMSVFLKFASVTWEVLEKHCLVTRFFTVVT